MPKILKVLFIGIGCLFLLVVAIVAVVAATFNPNDYKPLIIKLVQEKKQRTLSIPGEIKLTFFPRIGANLGKVAISEQNGSGEFASVERASVSLELIPIFSKQFVVDRIKVDGLNARVHRRRDGATNFDDLLAKEESRSPQQVKVRLNIDGVTVTNSRLSYLDDIDNCKFVLSNIELTTDPIANNKKSKLELAADVTGENPKLALKVKMKSGFMLDLEQKHYVLTKLDAAIHGALADFSNLNATIAGNADLKPAARQFTLDDLSVALDAKRGAQTMQAKFSAPRLSVTDVQVSGAKIAAEAKLVEGSGSIDAKFSAPTFEGSPKAFKIPAVSLDATVKQGALNATAKLTGALDGDLDALLFRSPKLGLAFDGKHGDLAIKGNVNAQLSANMKSQTIELTRLATDLVLPNPGGGTLAFNGAGQASVNLTRETAQLAIAGKLDGSTLEAKLGVAKFAQPAYSFDVTIDNIDADRYLARNAPAAKTDAVKAAAETPIDLAAVKSLNADGKLKVGSLKVANIKATNVQLALHAAAGRVEVNPLTAALYGGNVSGALSATAGNPQRVAMKQTLSNVNVGALLKDAIGKDPIDGQGNVVLNVTSTGATVSQIKKGLTGSASLDLKNGAVKGINLATVIRDAKSKIGMQQTNAAPQQGTSSAQEKTDFSELTASFKIANGVAHNDDLAAKSPLLRVGGSGDINLGEDRLDYTVKATVVPTLQGQGGPELQAIKGLTIPVKLSGPFTAIGWKIDFVGMVGEIAKQKLDEKKQDVKAEVQKKVEEQKTRLQDQLKDKLKGLFGK